MGALPRNLSPPIHAHKGVTVRLSRRTAATAVLARHRIPCARPDRLRRRWRRRRQRRAHHADRHHLRHLRLRRPLRAVRRRDTRTSPSRPPTSTPVATPVPTAFTKLAAGSGLSDVVALEEGWLGAIMEVSDQFDGPPRLRHRGPQGPLGRLEVRPGHRPRRPRHRLRHRHRTGGPLLQRRRSSRPPACRPTVTRSPSCSLRRRLGELLRGRPGTTTTRPARRGTTTPASSGTPWSTSWRRATTPPTAS